MSVRNTAGVGKGPWVIQISREGQLMQLEKRKGVTIHNSVARGGGAVGMAGVETRHVSMPPPQHWSHWGSDSKACALKSLPEWF